MEERTSADHVALMLLCLAGALCSLSHDDPDQADREAKPMIPVLLQWGSLIQKAGTVRKSNEPEAVC